MGALEEQLGPAPRADLPRAERGGRAPAAAGAPPAVRVRAPQDRRPAAVPGLRRGRVAGGNAPVVGTTGSSSGAGLWRERVRAVHRIGPGRWQHADRERRPALKGLRAKLSPEGELLVAGPNVMRGVLEGPGADRRGAARRLVRHGRPGDDRRPGQYLARGPREGPQSSPSGMKVWPAGRRGRAPRRSGRSGRRGHSRPATRRWCDASSRTCCRQRQRPATVQWRSHRSRRSRDPTARDAIGAVLARCNARLAQHQRIASGVLVAEPDFPRTVGLGKVRRPYCRSPNKRRPRRPRHRPRATWGTPSTRPSPRCAGTCRPGRPDTGGFGLDSLALTELALALEEKPAWPSPTATCAWT